MPAWAPAVAAAAIGASGPALNLVRQDWWAGAAIVVVLAGAWELVLRFRLRSPRIGNALVVGAFILAPVAGWSSLGRAPVLVTLAGVLVADAALVSWQPTPRWKARPVPVAGLAIAPLTAAEAAWAFRGRIGPTALLLVLALLAVELHARRPARAERWSSAIVTAASAAGAAIGMVVFGLVASLLLYLPGLVGRGLDRARRRRPRPSYWRTRPAPTALQDRDTDRPFTSAAPALRWRRHLAGLGAIAALVAVVAVLPNRASPQDATPEQQRLLEVQRQKDAEQAADPSALPVALQGTPHAAELQIEQQTLRTNNLVVSDVGGLAVSDFEGDFTEVRDGVRRTLEPPTCSGCPTASVWMVGGSSGFGFGQRDEHTIASELVRVASEHGVSLRVRNLSVPGVTAHQELAKAEARLADGDEAPDLVLFYDGYNDTAGTMLDAAVNGIDPDRPAVLNFDDYAVMLERKVDPESVATPEALGALAATKYRRVIDQAEDRLGGQGIETLFVYQPDSLTSQRQYDAIEETAKMPPSFRTYTDRAMEVASSTLADEVLDLRHLFDDRHEPVFLDLMHTNEAGARLVAVQIWPALAAELDLQADG